MSAVSNLTFVDIVQGSSDSGSSFVFSNYDEAMSFAKWRSNNLAIGTGTDGIHVWNYNGGSGVWVSAVFTPYPNTNWP